MYRQWGGDIINMSVLPEAKLAREIEIPYQMVCMSTDYDSWREEDEAVTADIIIGNLNANAENARRLLAAILPKMGGRQNPLQGLTKQSIITAPDKRDAETLEKLSVLFPKGF